MLAECCGPMPGTRLPDRLAVGPHKDSRRLLYCCNRIAPCATALRGDHGAVHTLPSGERRAAPAPIAIEAVAAVAASCPPGHNARARHNARG